MNHALKQYQAAEAASCSPHRVRIPAKMPVEASGKKEHATSERNSGARKFKLHADTGACPFAAHSCGAKAGAIGATAIWLTRQRRGKPAQQRADLVGRP